MGGDQVIEDVSEKNKYDGREEEVGTFMRNTCQSVNTGNSHDIFIPMSM